MGSSLHQTPVEGPIVDMEKYASEAILPQMQYEERQSSGSTARSPSDQRTLRSVHKISKDDFFNRVTSYFKARPPSAFSRSPRNWSLRVPHTSYPSIPDAGVLPAEDEKGVQTWVEQVALQTALCLLHGAEPELLNLEFGHVTGKGTQGALSDVVFRMRNPHGCLKSKVNTLLVEVKCPWTLSLSDMKEISCAGDGLPPTPTKVTNYDSARSVLAQVYDYCKAQKHCFWIITTYDYWVFGVFSTDYRMALATDPIPHNNASPTVLQCIVYWLQSSTFRAGAFEIPKAPDLEFSVPCSRSLWMVTLRLWRERGLRELEPKFAQAGYVNPKDLQAKCNASLKKRNESVGLGTAWCGNNMVDACWEVFRLLKTPSHNLEWTVALTWLALLSEPVSVTSNLPCLEAAFETASLEEIHLEHHERSSHFRRAQSVDPMPPQIWRAGAAVKRVESLEDFYRDHASAEVAFVLDKYLPPSIQDRLKEMLKELRLLGPASQESQSEESGSETSSQPEEATLDHEDFTEPAPSKRPSKPRRSGARAPRISSGLLQDTVALWKTREGSQNAAGSSSPSRVAPTTTTYSVYRSDSSLTGSPATPREKRPMTRPLCSPSSEWTPGSDTTTGSPHSASGREDADEDDGRIGSLTDVLKQLGDLTIQSPRSDTSSVRPTSNGRSPLSTRNGDNGHGNPFIEPVPSLTIPARPVNDSPGRSSTDRSERSAGGSARSDDGGTAETEEVSCNSLVEEVKSNALIEHLIYHPDDNAGSFEDLVRLNKVPQATLDFIAEISRHASTVRNTASFRP